MTTDPLLKKAIALACQVHAGQVDKANAPYIDHPLRVMADLGTEGRDAMIAAVLHDTIEDGQVTPDQLRAEGFPGEAVRAVEIVTKQANEHGSDDAYERFIERIARSGSRLAMVVKLADLADNMDLRRLGREPTEKDVARNGKYERSRTRLEAALRELEASR